MRFHLMGLASCLVSLLGGGEPRVAYFADGFHGGIYGHYPAGYTGFIVEQLRTHPEWRINLEIEPETWDVVRVNEPEAYGALREMVMEGGRVEIVNPTYAQSYLFMASGESLVRQFEYGMRKTREHFPGVRLTTYSSEEPCFTSCLPGVLKSLGFEYAVLKNPDTCWGGYTAAHGGELVNWVGPDGTRMVAVPRYACEALEEGSCWQTTAWRNSAEYLAACFEQGIEHPVGMCLQDAGWRGGPWLGSDRVRDGYENRYVTWSDYIREVAGGASADEWEFSQEDVKPGLMWGAQVVQRIAQQSRAAEHRLLVAEKLGVMAWLRGGRPAGGAALDEAWRNVLLSQHHDCWIVPYNGRVGNTWADQVRRWTASADALSEISREGSVDVLLRGGRARGRRFVRLFNPSGCGVDGVVAVRVPSGFDASGVVSVDGEGRRFPVQMVEGAGAGKELLVRGQLPAMGYATVELVKGEAAEGGGVRVSEAGERVVMESDLYRVELDLARGGTIRSWLMKQVGRELVRDGERRFNELRGYFYERGEFCSSADGVVEARVLERGPLRAVVEVRGEVGGQPFRQRLTMEQSSSVLDCSLRIDWRGQPRIGEFEEKDGFKNRRRAAYDDRFKLLVHFPVELEGQRVFKNAAFDVCESGLEDTFYNSWEGIKHNLILDWVDVVDAKGEAGLALFSDHTTSYAHGAGHPLALTVQYAGKGLWGRDYGVDGPTELCYGLMPHAGDWERAGVAKTSALWQEPAWGEMSGGGEAGVWSVMEPGDAGWVVPAMFERDGAVYVRVFNAGGDDSVRTVGFGFRAAKAELVELDGRVVGELPMEDRTGGGSIRLGIPRFGVRTLRFSGMEGAGL
ncbi:MAG: hypothetical protein RI897_603 [Verrucomicrobiota bacterium]